MSATLSSGVRASRLQVIADSLSGGKLMLYSGARPGIDSPPTGTLQCEIDLAAPAATVSGNTLSFVSVFEGMRTAADPIAWGRFTTAGGDAVMDVDVSVAGGGGDIVIDNPSGLVGGFVQLTAATISE